MTTNNLSTVLLRGPCCFCSYNGPNFYQTHTHKFDCPWFTIGSYNARNSYLIKAAREGRIQILKEIPIKYNYDYRAERNKEI